MARIFVEGAESESETMSAIPGQTPHPVPPLAGPHRLELAKRHYREYHARCFCHRPRDLVITEDLIPLVVQG